ncbi:MAG: hypothetical protein LUE87_03690 [Lachnospiraceae bacterium]|nr:hypothetical protein [Lachnospiraceae bacterium]
MKLQIEMNDHPYEDGLTYAAVSLRGGFITRNYLLGEEGEFRGNCAFFNVLFNYFRLTQQKPGLHYDVQRAASYLSFGVKSEDFVPTLNDVLAMLFCHEYSREKFEEAKTKTRDGFAACYKDGSFRARYKAYEVSDLNKRFTLTTLIRDVDEINFETFEACARALLVPGNVCIYVAGDTGALKMEETDIGEGKKLPQYIPLIGGYGYDPYLREDAHIIGLARQNCNIMVEAFDFMNPQITNFARLLILELLAEQMSLRSAEVWVDPLDASIVFESERPEKYKDKFLIMSEEGFLAAKKKLLVKYGLLLEKSPENFAVKAAVMMGIGVYADQYLAYVNTYSWERFEEILRKSDLKISEAQIVLRKGEN